MRTVLNIIWFVLGGFWLACGYVLAGIIALFPIVTIPISVACFRMARYVLWPFGKTVVEDPSAGAGSGIANVIWFVLCGWWLVIAHVATALAQALTIVGILNAVVSLKMIPIACFPFGKRIVNSTW